MSDSKSVKMHYDVAGDDFDRAGEASAGLKRLLTRKLAFRQIYQTYCYWNL